MSAVQQFLKEIRIEHTLFALPFAYVGALFGANGLPPAHAIIWITIAVLGARTAAMAANRYFDRDIDARNPRTARRALASGTMSPNVMLAAVIAGILLLLVAAWQLNPLCVRLLPLAALGLLVYPLCKRFTWLTHFVLGAVDGLAPLGAYVAVSGTVSISAVALFFAVTVWVAGFDVLYALMDLPIDRAQGIHSLPAQFGERSARTLSIALHAAMLLLLLAAGMLAHAAWWYYFGLLAGLALIADELRLLARARDVFALNERVFRANMSFSVAFLATTIAAFTLERL